MASAAAVAADAARSPLGAEVDEANGIVSTITANDDEHTGLTSDEDEDVPSRPRRPQRPAVKDADGEEQQGNGLDDLFGDEEDAEDKPRRSLDDEELDSGDDEDRDDRAGENAEEVEMVAQERQVQDVEYPRLPEPDPTDGEMYLLKIPKFLSIDAHSFTAEDFKAPTADHHSKTASSNFSAFNTALTTSNARINRWSDGSLTIQFASQPTVQYEINGNALAPPQRDPVIPTPTSVPADSKAGKFDPTKHAWTYLVAPMPSRGLTRVTNVLTTGLTVSPPADYIDEAIANLQSDLAAAAGPKRLNGSGAAVGRMETIEDPELAKKRAEQAEREKLRARKKQEAQLERERDRSNRALGRSGLSSQRFGGLSAGALEDDGLATTRGRTATKPKAARRRRANSEYSSEEDYGRRGFKASKEDDYDEEDDFVAGSDEEEEVPDDEEDEDDGIIEEGRAARREATPKRGRDVDDEEDAEGEVDDAPAAGAERKRRRVVVADDEDEDE
ncbi:hypothetical protein AMS68_007778 [Peltaster fructicola]|uniref:Uncharacterized protein n=1 Tax=Peltaster fructicola TaxID=286661 RepID=A0A6H0Y5Q4_9PEZI|nr:hypothetical protein AMS68_007778 [Peltaster fructicola]